MIEVYQPVAEVSDTEPGGRIIATVNGKEVGIFNVDGIFHAFLNKCPHMGAPLCKGRLSEEIQAEKPGAFKIKENFVLRCPWHGWEFDMDSGKSLFDESIFAKKYSVKILSGTVYCKI